MVINNIRYKVTCAVFWSLVSVQTVGFIALSSLDAEMGSPLDICSSATDKGVSQELLVHLLHHMFVQSDFVPEEKPLSSNLICFHRM